MRNFGLIVVGDELLSGRRQDKHLAKVIELLGARGQSLSWASYLGDDRELLTDTLRRAFAGEDIVFCCGGIGATPDDHTRQAAGAALGRPLALHPEARALITLRMEEVARERGETFDADRPDNRHRLNMGVFPEGASIIPNPYNRIPGFSVARVHFVPGFPVMAHPMIEWVLETSYGDLVARDWTEISCIVRGGLEADLTPLMETIEHEFVGVKVFSLPSVDHPERGRHIELGVKGSADAAQTAFRRLRALLDERPGLSIEDLPA